MSDNEQAESDEKPFFVDRAKQGRAACKKCKEKCPVGELRIGKIVPSPFGTGKMKSWYHLNCIFEQFLKQRPTTKRIESPGDIDGWDALNELDKKEILLRIEESEKAVGEKYRINVSAKKRKAESPTKATVSNQDLIINNQTRVSKGKNSNEDEASSEKDDRSLPFKDFRRLLCDITNVDSYIEKSNIVNKMFNKGIDGEGFKGNISQWCRLLLPGVIKRIYNLQNKQLVKLFSKIYQVDQTAMLEHSKQGDISETIANFFENNEIIRPNKKCILTIQEVDNFLEELSQLTKETEQMNHFNAIVKKCTPNDLKTIIRLVTHDLRINAGAKHILDGVHPDAYSMYQSCRDLDAVINQCLKKKHKSSKINAAISIMTPVQPMLAEACKSVEQAMKKCPNGIFAEIKYDGERVQLHKCGSDFKYFSRHLKPVLPHKVAHFRDYISEAFPYGNDLILDGEILMVDTISGTPLPFGTLGIHKKNQFKDATVCLFIFDCLYYNGESLVQHPIEYRKKILHENMTEIPNRIMFSEMEVIKTPNELSLLIAKVLKKGLEGLVLKDIKSIYQPGKRHWLKVKKDYLHDGAMADTADLIVLGAWYGTGKKGGMMSVFLMGCYDPATKSFCTVTKVHTGHDDKTLEQLQKELKMVKINCDSTKVPDWLKCTKTMIPDFVAQDPKQQPVWEITGSEFTKHEVHTADGISVRFPRVTRIRNDKDWKTATNLKELNDLYNNSKDKIDVTLLMNFQNESGSSSSNNGSSNKKTKDTSKKLKQDDTLTETKVKSKRKLDVEINSLVASPKKLKTESNIILESNSDAEADCIMKIKNPLADIFQNVKLLVEHGPIEEFKKWLRYFTAYGGLILKPEEWKNATHVLHLHDIVQEQNIISPKTARHITVDWIRDSVSNNNLVNFRYHSVRWIPSN